MRMPVHPQQPKDPSLVPMQIEIATIPSRDWPWFAKSLVLGALFLFILVFEIAGLMGFGWLGVRGALGLQDQHWIGTGMAVIAAVGLGFAIYHQLPLMVGEISGRYTLQITHDSVAVPRRCPSQPHSLVRLQGLIRTSLLAHSAPCSPSVPTRTSEQIGSE